MNFFIKFLLVFIFFLFLCLYLVNKYQTPYKLSFIFGKKGAGKSTYMVKQILRYHKKGWIVYSDIPDLNLPYVIKISAPDLESFTPCENSLLCLDEISLTWSNRDFKNFKKGIEEFFRFQRKYRVRVIVNSQSFDVDKKIRSLVDDMALCSQIIGCFSLYRPIRRIITLTEPFGDSESRIADQLEFRSIFSWKLIYMPRYFKYFDSFSAPHRDLIDLSPNTIKSAYLD